MKGLASSVLLAATLCCAASAPQPPCGNATFPAYTAVDSPPAVQVWTSIDWMPPACTGWAPAGASTLVATAARFRCPSGIDGLRRRIAAVSGMSGMLYWSTSSQRWQPLIVTASALEGPGTDRVRKDFSLDEIAEGRTLYTQQEDSLLGKASYRMRILRLAAGRLVFATENSAPIRYFGIQIFDPGEIQAIYFLERESGDVCRYYSLARMGKRASLLTGGHDASLINRAVAGYRYLAGIPLDQEPPASR